MEKKFDLMYEGVDYQMSVILQNMIATWGEEKVRSFFLDLVYARDIKSILVKKPKKKKAQGEL
jgi:hypothetical protein